MEVFVDESIHTDADAIVTALVFAEGSVGKDVADALSKCGFVPGVDEFKSRSPKAGDEQARRLRGELKHILWSKGCSLALCVDPLKRRDVLALGAIDLITAIIAAGRVSDREALPIFLDDGLVNATVRRELRSKHLNPCLKIREESDSKAVLGLQLADLCAHSAATMLRSRMGLIKKEYPAGEGTGYDSSTMIELGFELWAGLRHNMSSGERLLDNGSEDQTSVATMKPFGLRVSDDCSEAVKIAAELAFGSVYVGCIH